MHTVLSQYQPPVCKQKTAQLKRFPPSELCHAVHGHSVRCAFIDVHVHHHFCCFFYLPVIKLQSVKARDINLLVLSALIQKCCTCDLQMKQSIRDMLGFGVPDMICLKL